ncbi:hypothetical protein U0070_001647 [Myodes glareolus]|uniref:Uncharacterized protein n=1 Tax=Myodes glareolus TaxID=447135 RepID=A0AAW0J6S2_MYOGA
MSYVLKFSVPWMMTPRLTLVHRKKNLLSNKLIWRYLEFEKYKYTTSVLIVESDSIHNVLLTEQRLQPPNQPPSWQPGRRSQRITWRRYTQTPKPGSFTILLVLKLKSKVGVAHTIDNFWAPDGLRLDLPSQFPETQYGFAKLNLELQTSEGPNQNLQQWTAQEADLEVILYGCTKSQKGDAEKWRRED